MALSFCLMPNDAHDRVHARVHDHDDDVAALGHDARMVHTNRKRLPELQSMRLRSMKRDFSFSSLNYLL